MGAPTSTIERQIRASRVDRRAFSPTFHSGTPRLIASRSPSATSATLRTAECFAATGFATAIAQCIICRMSTRRGFQRVLDGFQVMTSSPSTRQHKTSRMPSRGHPATSTICGKGADRFVTNRRSTIHRGGVYVQVHYASAFAIAALRLCQQREPFLFTRPWPDCELLRPAAGRLKLVHPHRRTNQHRCAWLWNVGRHNRSCTTLE